MGNPEYRTIRSRIAGDDTETDFGMIEGDVTGWDMGCRTMEFYVNNLAEGRGGTKEGVAH